MVLCAILQEAWFEVLLARSAVVSDIKGGMSAIFGKLLDVFWDPQGFDMHHGGVCLKLYEGMPLHVFMKMDVFMADEAALHAIFSCKGSSGLKPCFLCQNIFNAKLRPEIVKQDTTGFAQVHTCVDVEKLVLHTTQTIHGIAIRLASAAVTMSKTDFAELQTRLGWNFVPEGILMNARWRSLLWPTRHGMYDWMHVWLVHGVMNTHVGLMMRALKPHGVTYAVLDEYTSQFHWPKCMGLAGKDVFCQKRAKSSWDDGSLKASASESLSVLPVLACFLQGVAKKSGNEVVQQHASSFALMAKTIEMLQNGGRRTICPDILQQSVAAHLTSFTALFGTEAMTPKFHYCLHFVDFSRRFGFVPNCFALERKHKVPKRFANEVRNTNCAWEASVLREVSSHHIGALTVGGKAHFQAEVALVAGHAASKKLNNSLQQEFGAPGVQFSAARCARINAWERCSVHDVVMVDVAGELVVGKVLLHAAATVGDQQQVFSSIAKWEFISEEGRSSKWLRRAEKMMCWTGNIMCAVTWAGSGEVVTVLKPQRV